MKWITCACGKHTYPWPAWYRVLRRLRLWRIAGWLYAKRFGHWAPGLIDLMDASTVLYAIGDDEARKWGVGL